VVDQQQKKRARKKRQELTARQKFMKAMSHNLRVRILAYMNDRPWSPRELSIELDEGLSQVSYHVGVLRDFDLIELVKTEPRRGAVEHFYRAVERAFMLSSVTKHYPKSGRRLMIVETIEDANMDIATSLASGRFDSRDDYHVSYTPGDLDGKGCEDSEKLADKFVEDFLGLVSESADRRANGEGDGEHIAVSASLLVFGSEQAEKEKAPSRKPSQARRRGSKKRG
jgi:DNA-binding transcriptional ArsR family regulator